jgi:hypothetical protein
MQNQRDIVIVNELWKTVDKAVVVTLPKIVEQVLSTNSQP